jgi:ankyrin repeat protein
VTTRSPIIAVLILATACVSHSPRDRTIDYIALCYAAEQRNALLVEALLERGAPVEPLDVDSAGMLSAQAVNFSSPLQTAARNGDVEIVRLILSHHPWVDHRCCDSPAALGYAAERGDVQIVELLLAAGADPSIVSSYDADLPEGTPMEVARKNGHAEVVKLLEGAKRKTP